MLAEVLAQLLRACRRDDEAWPLGESRKQRGEWLLEVERHRVRIDDCHRRDRRFQLSSLGRLRLGIQDALDVPLHRVRVEVGAVVELHASPELERDPLAVRGHLPGASQLRHHGEAPVQSDERVENQVVDIALGELHGEVRVECLRTRDPADPQRPAPHGHLRIRVTRERGQSQGQGQQGKAELAGGRVSRRSSRVCHLSRFL